MPINKERALEPIEFVQYLHLTGDFYGQPFILQKWQREVIGAVYGTVKENGLRQYQYAYLEIPRRTGKRKPRRLWLSIILFATAQADKSIVARLKNRRQPWHIKQRSK